MNNKPGLIESFQALLRGLLDYVLVRFELAGLESRHALRKVVSGLIGLTIALLCLAAGFLYLSLSLVYVLAQIAGWGWGWALLASGLGMVLITLGALFYVKNSLTGTWFPVTVAELKKDSQWLKQTTTPSA